MDANKFGAFVAAVRKERKLTQAQLAEILHVTDKAVSKWERGLSFPDIQMIEPLADALGVSVIELMRSERDPEVSADTADAALTDAFSLAAAQQKAQRKAVMMLLILVLFAVLLVFLADAIGYMGLLMVCLPVFCLLSGIALICYGIYRRRTGLPCRFTLLSGGILLAVPLILILLLFAAGAFGIGPVPS